MDADHLPENGQAPHHDGASGAPAPHEAPAGADGAAPGVVTPPGRERNPSSSFSSHPEPDTPREFALPDDPAASLHHRDRAPAPGRDLPAEPPLSLSFWRLSGDGSEPSPHLPREPATPEPESLRGILDGLPHDSVGRSDSRFLPHAHGGATGNGHAADGNGSNHDASRADAFDPLHQGLRIPPSLDPSLEALGDTDSHPERPPDSPEDIAAARTLHKPLPTPFPDDSLGPHYAIRRLVGEGGGGEVWEARQETLGRLVAIKRLRRHFYRKWGRDPLVVQRRELEFRQEAVLSARLDHPNIVPVYDLGADHRGRPLMAMKLVRGTPWSDRLAGDFGRLPVPEYLVQHLPVLIDVAQAIAFAHSRGIIHRDIKPSQVMTGAFGEVLLMDWGMALFVGSEAAAGELASLGPLPVQLPTIESASNPSGTPAFMAPEQTGEDARGIGTWTDVYLLGGTLYYLLTGTYPHNAPTSRGAMEMARAGVVEAPETRAPGREIPPDLAALAMKALEPEPGRRVGSALEFIAGLRDFQSGATRRREAEVAFEQVRGALREPERLGYHELSRLAAELERVTALWPQTSGLEQLRAEVATRHARQALARGDLALARAQALAIPERTTLGARRSELLEAADRKEGALLRTARQQRLFLGLSLLLLLVLAAGAAGFGLVQAGLNRRLEASHRALDERSAQLEREKATALAALEESQRLREHADDFVAVFLDEVYPVMAAEDTLATYGNALEKSLRYLESVPEESLSEVRREQLLSVLLAHGDNLRRAGRLAEAREIARRAVEEGERLVAVAAPPAPGELPRQAMLFRDGQVMTAEVHASAGQHAAALNAYLPAMEGIEQDLAAFPSNRRPHEMLRQRARLEFGMATSFAEFGRFGDAAPLLASAAKTYRQLAAAMPEKVRLRLFFGITRRDMGRVLRLMGDGAMGVEAARQSVAVMEAILAQQPDMMDAQAELAGSLTELGNTLADELTGDVEGALAAYEQADAIFRGLLARDAERHTVRQNYAAARSMSAQLLLQRFPDRAAEALDRTAEALVECDRLEPVPTVRYLRGGTHLLRALAYAKLGARSSAQTEFEESLSVVRALCADTDATFNRLLLAEVLIRRGEFDRASGREEQAEAAFLEAEQVLAGIMERDVIPMYLDEKARLLLLLGRTDQVAPFLAWLDAYGWKAPDLEELRRRHGLAFDPLPGMWHNEAGEVQYSASHRALLLELVRGGGKEGTYARLLMERGWRDPEFLRLAASIGVHPPEASRL